MTDTELGKCLFIGPKFFGYEEDIAEALSSLGYYVEFIDERPSNSSIARAVVRRSPGLMRSIVDAYYTKLAARLSNKTFDHVLLIKGEVVPAWFLAELRSLNPRAVFTFYTFDSVENSPNFLRLREYFDQLYSFDPRDVGAHGGLQYHPLFYTPHFIRSSHKRSADICFVGTLHSGRFQAVESIAKEFSPVDTYYYCPARWWYFVGRYVTKEFRNIPRARVGFKKLTRDDVAIRFGSAKVVLDIQRTGQAGLTMRTFEVLASGAGLVTSNPHARTIAAESGGRVLVLEDFNSPDAGERIREFMRSLEDSVLPEAFKQNYSVLSWARKIVAEQNLEELREASL